MKYLIAVLSLLTVVGCSQIEPQAVAVQETTTQAPQPVQVDQVTFKLLQTERLDQLGEYRPKGYLVHARYRITTLGDELVWVSTQYSQLQTEQGTYEQSLAAQNEAEQGVLFLMSQNQWNEVDVYFDVPSDDVSPGQLLLRYGKDTTPAKFDVDIS